MLITLIPLIFGLTAAISWGISDFLIGLSSKTVGPMKGALLVNTYGALVYGVIYLVFLRDSTSFNLDGIEYALTGSVFLGLGQALFFKAMNLGPVGLVSSISSVYPLVTLIGSVVLFAAHISLLQVIGILMIVCGVVAASGVLNSKMFWTRLSKGPLLALVPVLGWGLGWVFISHSITEMNWEGVFLIELLLTPIVLVLLTPFIKGSEHVTINDFRSGWMRPSIWGIAIIQMIGLLAVNIGLSKAPGSATIVIAFSTCYPVLTIFLALYHLHERIPLIPLIGGLLGIAGVVILSLGT